MADDAAEDVEDAAAVEVKEHRHSRKTAGRTNQTERQKKAKRKRMNELRDKPPAPLFPALQLLHDPQGLAERLYRNLRSCNEGFEFKLLLMNMISRVVGCHQLQLLSFYSFVQRYAVAAFHPLCHPKWRRFTFRAIHAFCQVSQ